MKKWINGILVFLLLLSGCGKSDQEIENERLEEQQSSRDEAWEIVNQAVEKLEKVPFHGEGYTNEVAHIMFGGFENALDTNDSSLVDKEALDGIFESYHYTIDSVNKNEMTFSKKDLLFGSLHNSGKSDAKISWGVGDEEFEVAGTFDNLKSDLTSRVGDEFVTNYSLIDGLLTRDDGKTYRYDDRTKIPPTNPNENEVTWDTVRYFNFMEILKNSEQDVYGFFTNRGMADSRLLEKDYFDGTIKKSKKETVVTFTFDLEKEENKEYIHNNFSSDMVDVVEQGSHEASLKEEFVSAKIIVKIDADGYLTSYYREGIWEYKAQNTKIPYVMSFTFNRT